MDFLPLLELRMYIFEIEIDNNDKSTIFKHPNDEKEFGEKIT